MAARTKQQNEWTELDPSEIDNETSALHSELSRLVIGQPEACAAITNVWQMHYAGLSAPGRPIGNFLFLGPTGTGKTRTVEALAEALLHSPRGVVKIDCAEFQHSHEIAKLIGSPPGYVGHRETHPLLSQEVINQHHTDDVKLSLILFDEIEKANDSLWNLLLGILDKATLTLGDNRRVDFSRCMIFMTSNLGAKEMNQLVNTRIGFQGASLTGDELNEKVANTGLAAARKKFTPEFMNRIDKVVVFKSLGEEQLKEILDLELQAVQTRIIGSSSNSPFLVTVTRQAKDYLLSKGIDERYGARHLKRTIERLVTHKLAALLSSGQVSKGDAIEIGYEAGDLSFRRAPREALVA